MGKLEEAETLSREALSVRVRTLGGEHPDTLGSISNFALLLQAQGKRAEALELSRRALAGFHRALGEGHPSTQRALGLYIELQG